MFGFGHCDINKQPCGKCSRCQKEQKEREEYKVSMARVDREIRSNPNKWQGKAIARGWSPALGDCLAMRGIGQGCGKCPACCEHEATSGKTQAQLGAEFWERSDRADYERLKERFG